VRGNPRSARGAGPTIVKAGGRVSGVDGPIRDGTALALTRGVDTDDLKARILDYLSRHPAAKDTLQGIAGFWVSAEPEPVARALRALVEEGRVDELRSHGTVHYQRRRP
jgi:hypothetical protein